MITSKKELKYYIECDNRALGTTRISIGERLKRCLFPHRIQRFQKSLRKCEYHKNKASNVFHLLAFIYRYFWHERLAVKLGFSIPLNVFGPGLAIVHSGTIVVSVNAKVGANCRLHPSTCIGASGGEEGAPVIGDNVYIGPGAKVYGDIKIGSNNAIAANAAVNKSFEENNILIGGVPAVEIQKIDINKIIKHI